MSDFPGYIEITCPFCGRYCHVRTKELDAFRPRALPKKPEGVVCDDCWRLVKKFVKRALADKRGTP